MRRGALNWLLSVVLAALPWATELRAQHGSAGPTVDRIFSVSDGLPSPRVRRVLASAPTGAWVLTAAGLARYDGFLFHSVGATEGLPAGDPIDILRVPGTGDGVIVVYANALFRSTGSGFTPLPVPDSIWSRTARLAVAGNDSTFVIRGNRVWLVESTGATDVHERLGLGTRRVSRLWSTRRGSLWLLTDGGLLHWTAGQLTARVEWEGAGLGVSVLAERSDGHGGLFSVTDPRSSRGLWEWTDGERPQRLLQEGVDEVSSIASGEGVVALTQLNGDAQVRRRGQRLFEDVGGPALGRFTSADIGADGTIWFGTERGLLARSPAPRSIWTQRRFAASRLGNRIHEILRAADGTLWLATADGLQVIAPDGRTRWIREAAGVQLNTVTGLAEAPAGTIWVSSGGDFPGVLRFDGRRWEHDLADGLFNGVFGHRLRVGAAGDLWLLGLGKAAPYSYAPSEAVGVFRRENGEWRAFRPSGVGLEGERVYEMDEGADGALWFATNHGIRRFHAGRWRQWTEVDGLDATQVFSLAADADGGVWFAHANGRRVGRITPEGSVRFQSLPVSLDGAEVWSLRRGSDGRVWLGADGGIAMLHQGDWIGLGSKDGLPNTSIWPVVEEPGTALLGSGDGLVTLDLAAAEAIPAPAVSLSVHASDRRGLEANWKIGTGRADIDPHQVETRWRRDGGAWSPWSTKRHLSVTGLYGGRHVVSVQARGLMGRVGQAASMEVQVAGPVWTSWWVIAPSVLALVAGLAASLIGLQGRRRAHALLRRAADAYTEIYREAPDGYIIERLPDRRIEQANARAAALFGVREASELAGVTLEALLAPESRDALRDATAGLLASGRASVELRGRRADGSEFDLEVTSTGVPDVAGDLDRSRTMLRDVTDRTRAQRDLRRFRLTLDTSFEPALWIRADGEIVYVNQAFRRLASASEESLVGHRLSEAWPAAAALQALLWEQLEVRRTALFETELPVDSAPAIPVEVAGTLLPGVGELLASVFVRDIRARRLGEALRLEQAEQLERARRLQALGSMGRAVAHEFNNILAAIMGFGEMLVAELRSADVARSHALEITRAAERGSELVAEVMASTGGRSGKRVPVRFSPIVEEVVANEAGPALTQLLQLRLDLALGSEAAVRCVRSELQRAVRNVVRNAVEALPASGGTLHVETIDLEIDESQATALGLVAGPYVALRVRDDGPGMTPEVHQQAFDPFFTTKAHRFGLGLSVVRVVAAELHGAVRIESAPGAGTLCELLLPAVAQVEEPTVPDPAAPPSNAAGAIPPTLGRRILVVDDDRTVLRMTGMLVTRLGYELTSAASGAEALRLMGERPDAFDLLLTDLSMPGMSGLELAAAVRVLRPEIPILVVSGHVDAMLRAELEAVGACTVLPKPFGKQELRTALEAITGSG